MTYLEYAEARRNGEPIIKLAGIEFYKQELNEHFEAGTVYIVKYKSIYLLEPANYKTEPKVKARKVYESTGTLTRRGRYYSMTREQVNKLLGRELFI